MRQSAIAAMRAVIGSKELDTLFRNRVDLNEYVTEGWFYSIFFNFLFTKILFFKIQ